MVGRHRVIANRGPFFYRGPIATMWEPVELALFRVLPQVVGDTPPTSVSVEVQTTCRAHASGSWRRQSGDPEGRPQDLMTNRRSGELLAGRARARRLTALATRRFDLSAG